MDQRHSDSDCSADSGVSVSSIEQPPFFSSESFLKENGYQLVSEQEKMVLVKNKNGDQFVIKKLSADQGAVSNFLKPLNHPHIVHHEEVIKDGDFLYLVLEHCEGGDLSQKINNKTNRTATFSEMMTELQGDNAAKPKTVNRGLTRRAKENNQILDWTVKICMALKHLHDQQILHKNLQPKSIFFTACGTIRLGEFGAIHEWSSDEQTAETKAFSYVAPENLNGKPFDEKSEIWSLGCLIYEMCTLKCAFSGRNPADIISKILTCSYEALPKTFSEDLRQLVTDTLQIDPENRTSVSEILMRPFIIKHLHQKSTQTTEELYKSLKSLEELANGLEKVHYGTTVGSLAGGVVGLAGGITSLVGLVLAPFTLGASLIVTGVGIGVAVAGGAAAGVSNITKMVNERTDRQMIKMTITEIEEKITSTGICIQNIQIAVETQKVLSESNNSWSNEQSGAEWANAGARLGRGLGGIAELVRLTQVGNVGRIAAQTARVVRVAEAVTGVLTGLFVAVDIFFIVFDAIEIHKLRKDYASIATQQETENAETDTESKSNQTPGSELSNTKNHSSTSKKVQELRSEIMKLVKKIKETKEELNTNLDKLKAELKKLEPEIQKQITMN